MNFIDHLSLDKIVFNYPFSLSAKKYSQIAARKRSKNCFFILDHN